MTHTSTEQPEALRLADKYEAEGFLQDHRFAQDHWCRQAATELRRLHAANIICRAWHEEDQQEIASLQVRLEASKKSNADLAARIHALVEAAAIIAFWCEYLIEPGGHETLQPETIARQ